MRVPADNVDGGAGNARQTRLWVNRLAPALGFTSPAYGDHLALYDLVELRHARLQKIVARISSLPYVAASQPR